MPGTEHDGTMAGKQQSWVQRDLIPHLAHRAGECRECRRRHLCSAQDPEHVQWARHVGSRKQPKASGRGAPLRPCCSTPATYGAHNNCPCHAQQQPCIAGQQTTRGAPAVRGGLQATRVVDVERWLELRTGSREGCQAGRALARTTRGELDAQNRCSSSTRSRRK